MSYYLATHKHSGQSLFSHRDDALKWVEYQADYHRQEIGKWTTHGQEESLRLADGKTYAGTVRSMTLDEHAEHRQYEAEQRAESREAEAAADANEVVALRARIADLERDLAVARQILGTADQPATVCPGCGCQAHTGFCDSCGCLDSRTSQP